MLHVHVHVHVHVHATTPRAHTAIHVSTSIHVLPCIKYTSIHCITCILLQEVLAGIFSGSAVDGTGTASLTDIELGVLL